MTKVMKVVVVAIIAALLIASLVSVVNAESISFGSINETTVTKDAKDTKGTKGKEEITMIQLIVGNKGKGKTKDLLARVNEAIKLGFEECILPAACLKSIGKEDRIKLTEISSVAELCNR